MRTARATAMAAAAIFVSLAGAGTASAEPQRTWLPDADLFCPSDTLVTGEWGGLPGSDSMWIKDGPHAGHYVIVTDSHYFMPGLQVAPPESYEGLDQVGYLVRGKKAGLAQDAITCQFVSRWDMSGDEEDFSIVGPVTMVRVSR
jgi:hypothetical protein